MLDEPIHKREIAIFLSHASVDKSVIVDQMYHWLNNIARIPVWYDRESLSGGEAFVSVLAEAIPLCRSMVIVLSKASVKSAWVEEEYSLALNHQAQFRDFKIIPVVIEDCEIPGFLRNKNYIRAEKGELTLDFCYQLLRALYPGAVYPRHLNIRDVYVSRTWRDRESKFADTICNAFVDARFRLIGDTKDHPSFKNSKHRVETMVASCGGLLAILPYRTESKDSGYTSPYMLEEIGFAQQHKLPYVVLAEKGVVISEDICKSSAYCAELTPGPDLVGETALVAAVEAMRDQWKESIHEHYVFFATDFNYPERNELIRQTIQRITAMRCEMGEDIYIPEGSLQQEIVNNIQNAFVVVGDISEDNINTLIEIGIARGANVNYYMVAASPRHQPPFMLRDRQVFYYQNDAELLGRVHRLVYPYRRRVLNAELH